MSVIFGIFYRDDRPVTSELEAMYSGIGHFPHERYAFIKKGNCGFGHMLTFNTPEAVHESMPNWIESAQLMFAAEGRIDNRDELFETLGISAGEQATMPDGDLILAAYLKWGEQCTAQLLGKWSLAAFHMADQRLFVARDKCDNTAIDYYEDNQVFAFAPSARGILTLPFVPTELDELTVALKLTAVPGYDERSSFKGIKRLLRSRTVRVTRENLVVTRYWHPADIAIREGLKLEDYVEGLFENLNRATLARLRSYGPIAAMLSGGMDSSTVAFLAAEHLAKQGKRLRTYTHVPQFAPSRTLALNRFGDERPYAEAIVAASGNIDPVFLDSAEISPLEGIEKAVDMTWEINRGGANTFWTSDIEISARRDGYRTLLNGASGNATISLNGKEVALPTGEFFRRYGAWNGVKQKLLKPILFGDTPFGDLYKRIVLDRHIHGRLYFISPAFARASGLGALIENSHHNPAFIQKNIRDAQAAGVLNLEANVRVTCLRAKVDNHLGFEGRDPSNDVRVIGSALSIPNSMYFGAMNKWVFRTMMKGRLPDVVRLNRKKGKQSSDLPARLVAHRAEMDSVLSEIEGADFAWMVNIKNMRDEWRRMKADTANYPVDRAGSLLRPICVYLACRRFSSLGKSRVA